jgi:hypothetical protein
MMKHVNEITNAVREHGRLRVAVMLLLTAVVFGAFIGFARASAPSPNTIPNTLGKGAHPYPITVTTPVSAASTAVDASATRAVLSNGGATGTASIVASVGEGGSKAVLLAAKLPDGRDCLTVAHFGGTVLEPLNCSTDAYMRIWLDASGKPGAVMTTEVIVVVAREVNAVQASFPDGSTLTKNPDANGVITFETNRGAPAIEALAADGSSLGSIGS